MRVMFRITLTLLIAPLMFLLLTILWALPGARDASPEVEKPKLTSDARASR